MENKNLKKMVETEMKKRGLMEQEMMMGESNPFVEMVSKLRFSVEQTQVYHWQSQSYSEHKALNKYYDGIPVIVDGIVESYQGKHGIVTGYTPAEKFDEFDKSTVIKYFKGLAMFVERAYAKLPQEDTYILNQIDNVKELIYSTIYKLENLS